MTAQSAACAMCAFTSDATVVYEDPVWNVRSISKQSAIAGWLIMQSRRHIADVSELNAEESSSFGPLLSRVACVLRSAASVVATSAPTPLLATDLKPLARSAG